MTTQPPDLAAKRAASWWEAAKTLNRWGTAHRELHRSALAERDALQERVTTQEQVLEIIRAQTDDCVEKVDTVLGHRYHVPGIHYSIPHVAEKAAAEIEQLQARLDAALALHAPYSDADQHCKTCGVDAHENEIPWPCDTARALQGDQPTERTYATRHLGDPDPRDPGFCRCGLGLNAWVHTDTTHYHEISLGRRPTGEADRG